MANLIVRLARWVAVFGGAVLILLVLITTFSVIGRSLNTVGNFAFVKEAVPALAALLNEFGPINGDYELIEIGAAIAVFSFLPWCTIVRGHATVDVFTSGLSRRANSVLETLWEAVMFVVLTVIAWRMYHGMLDKFANGETTLLLQLPVWRGYALCLVPAALAAVSSGLMVVARLAEIGGRRIVHIAPRSAEQ